MPPRMRLLPAVALGLTVLAAAAPSRPGPRARDHPRVPARGGRAGAHQPAAGRLRAGAGPRRRPGARSRATPRTSWRDTPSCAHCDASPCLKSIGQVLDVGYIVRVKVDVAGNSYKGVARLFSTEGAAPAALPIATESKSCDVCTVAEARATMLRLADAVRSHIDEPIPLQAPPPPPPPPPRAAPDRAGAGGDGRRAGGRPPGPPCWPRRGAARPPPARRTGRATSAAAILLGAGAALTVTGAYVTIVRARGGDPVTGVAVGWRW